MTSKLPCCAVRDLLPLYVEGLTSPETDEQLREHLAACGPCREIYGQMASPEPEPEQEPRELDYLKKIKKGRLRLLLGSLLALAVIAAGLFFYFKAQADRTVVNIDEASGTLIVYGRGDSAGLELPEEVRLARNLDAQFDSFHLAANLSVLRPEGEALETYLPAFLNRTDESLHFLRNYLHENCADSYPAERADKYVELSVLANGSYDWTEQDDRIRLDIGDYYWHREELYVLALLGSRSVEWKQLGYAWYLGTCLNPHSEALATWNDGLEDRRYYEAYVRGGGTAEASPENYRILSDAASYVCLTEGMYWGTPYESMPLKYTALFSGPKKVSYPGNDMSVCMATSFVGYLADRCGFSELSAFCFGQKGFRSAFGTDYQSAYDGWTEWILETYGES